MGGEAARELELAPSLCFSFVLSLLLHVRRSWNCLVALASEGQDYFKYYPAITLPCSSP